jgi:hypothetical protein
LNSSLEEWNGRLYVLSFCNKKAVMRQGLEGKRCRCHRYLFTQARTGKNWTVAGFPVGSRIWNIFGLGQKSASVWEEYGKLLRRILLMRLNGFCLFSRYVQYRVSSKQTKINFGSNWNKPKQDLFRFVSWN